MDFSWLNESELKREEEGKLVIFAPAGTDFFCNNGTVSEEGITPESLHNAPYYYTEIEGDFVLTVKVSHDFKDIYDSSSLIGHGKIWTTGQKAALKKPISELMPLSAL